ncbi:MAG: hypothetical protein LBG43_02145 [Treponema sp.]|jgi:hypothetical protein|nr:hypothetical protein [Treponema sp.]
MDAAIELYIDIIQSYIGSNQKSRALLEHNPRLAEKLNMLFFDGLIRNKRRWRGAGWRTRRGSFQPSV